jgi:hypothetical protein
MALISSGLSGFFGRTMASAMGLSQSPPNQSRATLAFISTLALTLPLTGSFPSTIQSRRFRAAGPLEGPLVPGA